MISEGQIATYRTASPQSGSPIISQREPQHLRNPSLGELHQELEQEQEAQVVSHYAAIIEELIYRIMSLMVEKNRLLQMIRAQQEQLQQLQAASGQSHTAPPAIDESTPTSERSMSFSHPPIPQLPSATSTPRSPTSALHPRSSFDLARSDLHRRSRTPSRTASPRIRSTSISGEGGEHWSLGGRDESAFYQAETQMMVRENQMLRQRIRELGALCYLQFLDKGLMILERQVTELHANSAITHEPATPSRLLRSVSASEGPGIEVPATRLSESTEVKDD